MLERLEVIRKTYEANWRVQWRCLLHLNIREDSSCTPLAVILIGEEFFFEDCEDLIALG